MSWRRSLAFRVIVPIVGFTLLLAGAVIAFAWYRSWHFAQGQAETNLRLQAHTVQQIADDYFERSTEPDRARSVANVRDQRVNALLAIEDFARTNDLLVVVVDTPRKRQIKLGDLAVEAPASLWERPVAEHRFEAGGNRFRAHTIAFEPWGWRIALIQDSRAYDALQRELLRGALIAAGILIAAVFLFLIYLTSIMRRPIGRIVDDVKAGQAPRYAGIAEFEFLAASIAEMMAALREKTAAVENYRDHLEQLVAERTAELTQANAALLVSHRELDATHHQLLQSEKLASIGQLAAGVAHEINNPIGFVNSNLGILGGYVRSLLRVIECYERHADATPCDPALRAEIEAVRLEVDIEFVKTDFGPLFDESMDGLERVKKIVLDLREFSRVGSRDWQPADLHRGLDSTLNIVWNELKYKAKVVKEYGDLPEVECLPAELNQVFMNLLVNAGHAIGEHGTIAIRTTSDGKDVTVAIEDTGCGIAPEVLPRIFDPFFTTKPVGQGTGLGLSLAYGIVQKHHGRIKVESVPGRTCFQIHLPIVQPEQRAAERSEPVSAPGAALGSPKT